MSRQCSDSGQSNPSQRQIAFALRIQRSKYKNQKSIFLVPYSRQILETPLAIIKKRNDLLIQFPVLAGS